jgi:hypothetical protein
MRLLVLFAVPLAVLAVGAAQSSSPDANAAKETNIRGKDSITLGAPPAVKTAPVVDSYQTAGAAEAVEVTDNYRWLERRKVRRRGRLSRRKMLIRDTISTR